VRRKKPWFWPLGNPYVAQDFPTIQNYLCTFSNASVSESSAVKALFGEIAIRAICRSLFPTLRNAAPASSGRSKSQTKDRNMRRLKLRDGNSALALNCRRS